MATTVLPAAQFPSLPAPSAADPSPEPVSTRGEAFRRCEVFGLDEGEVTLMFPEPLSAASVADLEAHLELLLRRLRRRAGVEGAGPT